MRIDRTERARAGDALIAGAGFDSAAVAPADRFEAWRAYMEPAQHIRPVQGVCRDPSVSSTGWALDDLILSELAFSPISYRRRPGKAGDCLLLRLYREGQAYGVFEGSSFRTRPGEIHLFDQSPECHGVTTDWHRLQSVFIPYAAVGYEPGRHPAHLGIEADSAVGRVLRAAIEALFAELPRTRQAEVAALAAGFASLVKGLLLTAPSAGDSRELDAARHLAMRRYVEEHLGDPQLGVASLCAAFGASRATIYRDFAEDGGVAHFLIRRRLELPRSRQRATRPGPRAAGRRTLGVRLPLSLQPGVPQAVRPVAERSLRGRPAGGQRRPLGTGRRHVRRPRRDQAELRRLTHQLDRHRSRRGR
jgi:AraC-like DNA-binding protein